MTLVTPLSAAAQQFTVAAGKISIVKQASELIAKDGMHWLASREFFHLKVPVDKLPVVTGDIVASESKLSKHMIVIDKNVNKVGRTANGYIPKVAVVCGYNILASAKTEELFTVDCWVGKEAIKTLKLDIRAAAAFPGSVNQLSNSLRRLLQDKVGNTKAYAYIRDIYPAQGFFVYNQSDKLLKQQYVTNPTSLKIALKGMPTPVFESYVDAPSEVAASVVPYPNNPSDDAYNPVVGGFGSNSGQGAYRDYRDYGAKGSELNSNFMSMLNIDEALSMYLSDLQNGIWRPISSQWATIPPSLLDATNEASLIAKEKGLQAFAPLDFVKWQQKILASSPSTKRVGKVEVHRSKFAYVGDTDDPSTWLFACTSRDNIKRHLVDLKGNSFIPKTKKKAIQATLEEKLDKATN